MKLGGSSSWRLETRDSQFLHVALYVRESAGIQIPADEGAPPRLRQETPPDAADPRDGARVLSEQWWAWWQSLVAFEVGAFEMTRGWQDGGDPPRLRALADAGSAAFDPPDFDTIAGLPELRAVVSRRWREALDWFAGRSAEPRHSRPGVPAISHAVIEHVALSVAAERRVALDRLDAAVDLLDVSGLWAHDAAPGYVLCSAELARDEDLTAHVVRRAFLSGLAGEARSS